MRKIEGVAKYIFIAIILIIRNCSEPLLLKDEIRVA